MKGDFRRLLGGLLLVSAAAGLAAPALGLGATVAAGLALGGAILVLGCAMVAPVAPLVIAAALVLTWAVLGAGFPLPWVVPRAAPMILAAGQALFAIGLLAGLGRGSARGGAFSWRRFFAVGAVLALALPVFAAGGLLTLAARQIESQSGGYIALRADGLRLEERVFERDGRRVRLIGMMHIGSADFYREVQDSLAGREPTVVLLEGVTDERDVLGGRFSYARIAKALGLAAQEDSVFRPLRPEGGARGGAGRGWSIFARPISTWPSSAP